MNVKIHESWKQRLSSEFEKAYFIELTRFVRSEYASKTIFPSPADIFRAFELCPFEKVKGVILGQDPYHGVGQANGLCFSVHPGLALPPSLQNIFKEIQSDVGGSLRTQGSLEDWAKQGILLLNATLTVEAHQAGSHQKKGWEPFTDAVVSVLSREKEQLVFMLWGRYAQQKGAHIDADRHLILKAAHPSPFSAYDGFFGSKHFSQANAYFQAHGQEPVQWA